MRCGCKNQLMTCYQLILVTLKSFQPSAETKSTIFVTNPSIFEVFDQISKENPQELSFCLNSFRENLEQVAITAELPFQLISIDFRYSVASLHKGFFGQYPDFDNMNDLDADTETNAIGQRLNLFSQRDDVRPRLVLHLKQSTVLL